MHRNLLSILFAMLALGCASAPEAVREPECGVAADVAAAAPRRFVYAGPLSASDPRNVSLMTVSALEDERLAWLWIDLDLSGVRCARVEGRGALTLVLHTSEGELRLADEGIRVPLADGNTFLNSAGGPISIRPDDGAASRTVRMLVGVRGPLPAAVEAVDVEPDAKRWRLRR